ncbi:hypothetical protein LTR99_002338 [Exophiala xenobiotica]|uniref:FAD dependent oxidoreductase domain-containing protein n=1 Tax=Vermiconidia calcicola TaxID=1690605 RepID=A0AAV9QK32_9PEZI|nr:hypothetical protein LTR99_002338 [Exophiala xenobiotica]KAK5434093.1 hypothetical protein LTR34_003605 [Exophiala xenobiotica]KAK5542325.1 hypothetical protein LTR25_002210 [Vermiconidia calcicola]KAK5546183.1 hypothetical protein LTR23_003634 [Chaetothyriales sp. CCFEE 6169]
MSPDRIRGEPPPLQDKSAAITIVGAGVFGLSTAIHLAERGYTNITIFDKQPYHETRYSYFKGCDAASADMNKIFRSAYGSQTEYQSLSTEALGAWQQWNAEIASSSSGNDNDNDLPPGMSKDDRVFINNGNLSLTDKPTLPPFEMATVRNMNEAGHADTQLITYDPRHVQMAHERGFGFAIDPFKRKQRGRSYLGVLDTTGGTILADNACSFALHQAQRLGVRTVFGPESGTFASFIRATAQGTGTGTGTAHGERVVVGIRTLDGKSHHSSRTVIACGGWTPALLGPSLDSVCETTAGSVVMMKLPADLVAARRYAADKFPSWTYKMRDGAEGGLYGFPATDEGYMKIGYRGTKYTNPQVQEDGRERSVPITRYDSRPPQPGESAVATQVTTTITTTTDEQNLTQNQNQDENQNHTQIPTQALRVIKKFIADFLPELLPVANANNGIDMMTRLCWYTDSWDNHFVIDHVPGPDHENVFVATAGSGHAFKFLPNIGSWIADILEGKGLERPLVRSWRWRTRPDATEGKDKIVNELMEGSAGRRALARTQISSTSTPRRLGVVLQTAKL